MNPEGPTLTPEQAREIVSDLAGRWFQRALSGDECDALRVLLARLQQVEQERDEARDKFEALVAADDGVEQEVLVLRQRLAQLEADAIPREDRERALEEAQISERFGVRMQEYYAAKHYAEARRLLRLDPEQP